MESMARWVKRSNIEDLDWVWLAGSIYCGIAFNQRGAPADEQFGEKLSAFEPEN